jgi:hypothetical protein
MATQTSSFTNFNTLARAGEYTSGGNAYRWINRTNAQTSNNSYASLSYSDVSLVPQSAPTSLSSQTTNYFAITGLSSTIPSGATVNGITVKIERFNNNASGDFPLTIVDSAIYLTKDGSALVGSNKSTGATWQATDNNTTVDFGGVSDLWGTTWTAAEINSSTFGVLISPSISFSGYSETGGNVLIDQVTITIEYTGGAVRRQGIFTTKAELRTV